MKLDLPRITAGIVILAFLLACNGAGILPTEEPPGVGEKAEKGYAASEPVIAALEKYQTDHGSYPEKLAELVPDYLPAAPTKTDELDFSYSSTGDSYHFSFHYIGPGMNTCAFTPETKKWECSGAF
jgi:hypothetical protein